MLRKLASLINGILGVVLLLLAIRFIMEIFGIGPGSEFSKIIYTASGRLRDPLLSFFEWLGALESNASLLTFLTIVVYATVGWSISSFIGLFAQSKS